MNRWEEGPAGVRRGAQRPAKEQTGSLWRSEREKLQGNGVAGDLGRRPTQMKDLVREHRLDPNGEGNYSKVLGVMGLSDF